MSAVPCCDHPGRTTSGSMVNNGGQYGQQPMIEMLGTHAGLIRVAVQQ